MHVAKRMLMTVGVVALASLCLAVLTPKVAHGIVATFVQVVNDTAHPVPTMAADNPALNSFTVEAQCTFGNVTISCTADPVFSVPATKTAVIEFVSSECDVSAGGHPSLEVFYTSADQNPARFEVPYNSAESVDFVGFTVFLTSLRIRSYAAAGSSLRATWTTSTIQGSTSFCIIDLSGHYVNH